MPFCGNCGNENPAGARFCSNCGAEQIAIKASCSNCGKILEVNEKFCSGCGTPVSGEPSKEKAKTANPKSAEKEGKLTKEGRKIIDAGPVSSSRRPGKKSTAAKTVPKTKSPQKKKRSSLGCFFRTIFILASIVIGAAILIYVVNIFIEDNGAATQNTQKVAEKEEGQLAGTDIPGIVDIEPETGISTSEKGNKKTISDAIDENTADKYEYGIGVNNDQYKALELYEKLANQGDLNAMVHMSDYYEQGIWVKKDSQKARKLLQQAAEKGSLAAKWQLEFLESKEKVN